MAPPSYVRAIGSSDQVVELAVFCTVEEGGDLVTAVDERRAIGVARVSNGDAAVSQWSQFDAVANRPAVAALPPLDVDQLARGHSVADLWHPKPPPFLRLQSLHDHLHVQLIVQQGSRCRCTSECTCTRVRR